MKFHNGRTLTAEEVKFTLERLIDPETASEGASPCAGLATCRDQAATREEYEDAPRHLGHEARTSTIDLEEPDSVLLYLLGLPCVASRT